MIGKEGSDRGKATATKLDGSADMTAAVESARIVEIKDATAEMPPVKIVDETRVPLSAAAHLIFRRRVAGLARRVLTEKTPLNQIAVDAQEDARDRLVRAVQHRMLNLFAEIQLTCISIGDTSIVPAIRKRIADLFNLDEKRLAPTAGRIEHELLHYGNLYLSLAEGDYLPRAKLLIETRFISHCQDVEQQKKVIKIVAAIRDRDLTYVGRLGGFALFRLNAAVWENLCISSLLNDEERQGAKTKADQSGLNHDLDKLNLDWDVDW